MLHERTRYLTDLCRDQRVVHLGCADWPYTERRLAEGTLLHEHLSAVSREIVGVDLSVEGLKLLRNHRPDWKLIEADGLTYEPDFEPDIVILSELIEHVEDPGTLLRQVRSWATPHTKLALTTPNAYSMKGALRAAMGREYAHPDHVVMFSTKTLTALLERAGWTVDSISYYHVQSERALACAASKIVQIAAATILSNRIGDGIIALARPNPR